MENVTVHDVCLMFGRIFGQALPAFTADSIPEKELYSIWVELVDVEDEPAGKVFTRVLGEIGLEGKIVGPNLFSVKRRR